MDDIPSTAILAYNMTDRVTLPSRSTNVLTIIATSITVPSDADIVQEIPRCDGSSKSFIVVLNLGVEAASTITHPLLSPILR